MTTTIEHRHIPVAMLTESTTNPRKKFDAEALADLADSIRSQGLLQPITVRPHPRLTGWEVVFGHRRFRACQAAGMTEVPCIIRSMSDEAVLLAQVVENMARADVHPVEEAEAFRQLLDNHGKSADEIATEVGKSRTYVYNRLKLSSLTADARDECMRLGLGGEIATLISRVAPSLQMKAVSRCWSKDYGDGTPRVLSYRDARRALEHAYTTPLADVSWSIIDARLVPSAGSCVSCDKCSDNDPALMADLGAGVCTDTECAETKAAAHLERQIEDARAAGTYRQVEQWSDDDAPKRLASTAWRGHQDGSWTGVTYSQAIERLIAADSSFPAPQILQARQDGELHPSISRQDADRVELAIHLLMEPKQPDSDDQDEDEDTPSTAARSPAESLLTLEELAVREDWRPIKLALLKRVMTTPRTVDDLRMLVLRELDMSDDFGDDVIDVMGWRAVVDACTGYMAVTAKCLELIQQLDADQLGALLVMAAIDNNNGMFAHERLALCHRYSVDPNNPTADPATPERDPRVADLFATQEA